MSKYTLNEGINGQPKLELFLLSNDQLVTNSCDIYLLGSTVTSWKQDNIEKIFLSEKALFNGVKAIRGGIPIVFPVFGQPSKIPLPSDANPSILSMEKNPMAQHGFARTSLWSVQSVEELNNEGNPIVKAVLSLSDTEESLKLWPYKFTLLYTVTLSRNSLNTSLSIINKESDKMFSCQALLHTYLSIPNSSIDSSRVYGFQNRPYIDKLIPPPGLCEGEELLNGNNISEEIDRIYTYSQNISDIITISIDNNNQLDKVINITSKSYIKSTDSSSDNTNTNNTDIVFWNPWINKTLSIADFNSDAYKNFICIEPGLVSKFYDVNPNETLVLEQTLYI